MNELLKKDLNTNYFEKKNEEVKERSNKRMKRIKRNSNKKKSSQSNFAKLSIFQPSKYKFNKKCPLSGKGASIIDYKNVKLLKKFISEKGKILPSRITSVSSKKQRELSKAIKRARFLALLPYVNN